MTLEKLLSVGKDVMHVGFNSFRPSYLKRVIKQKMSLINKEPLLTSGWILYSASLSWTPKEETNFDFLLFSINLAVGVIAASSIKNYKTLRLSKDKLSLVDKVLDKEGFDNDYDTLLDVIHKYDGKALELVDQGLELKYFYLENLEKIITSYVDADESTFNLVKAGVKGGFSYNELDSLLENRNNTKYDKIYIEAMKKRWADWQGQNLVNLSERLHELKDDELIKRLPKLIKRGFKSGSIDNLLSYLQRLPKQETKNQLLDILEHLSRRDLNQSFYNTFSLIMEDELLSKKIFSLGKKKKAKLFSRLPRLTGLYGSIVVDKLKEINDFSKISNVDSFIQQQLLDYFDVSSISSSLLADDVNYVFKSYESKRNNTRKEFISSILNDKTLVDYRLTDGYYYESTVSSPKGYKLSFMKDASRYYEEAIRLLNEAGVELDYKGSKSEIIEDALEQLNQFTEYPVEQLKEYLEFSREYQFANSVNAETMTYKIGADLKDFAFSGRYPVSTCLGLGHMNDECLISMAANGDVYPFIVSANDSKGSSKIVKRAFLWSSTEDYFVIDDIYGDSKIDILTEAKKVAEANNKKLAVPKSQARSIKLSKSDQSLLKSRSLEDVTVDFGKLAYSDSYAHSKVSGLRTAPCYIVN